ncbi:MAG TPA: LysR family transcriptional regulator [Novosphingobium sp.]|nr:LysR family transcriptional regulator [Novosphingobium sp.]
MIELLMLRHFVAVVEEGGFTRASEKVYSSQPAVSRSVRRLEEIVGTPLLERTTRNVRPTPAGLRYYREVRPFIDRLQVATEAARRIGAGEAARLRVAVCPSVEAARLGTGFEEFRRQWPKVEIQLSPLPSTLQPQALGAAEIDVGIMGLPEDDRHAFEFRILARDPLMVAVPSAWNLRKSRIALAELRDRPWIMPDPDLAPRVHAQMVRLCRDAGFEPKVAAHVGDLVSGILLLACGVGAAFAPGRISGGNREGADLLLLEGLPDTHDSITIAAWAPGACTPHIEEFVSCMLASMNQHARE